MTPETPPATPDEQAATDAPEETPAPEQPATPGLITEVPADIAPEPRSSVDPEAVAASRAIITPTDIPGPLPAPRPVPPTPAVITEIPEELRPEPRPTTEAPVNSGFNEEVGGFSSVTTPTPEQGQLNSDMLVAAARSVAEASANAVQSAPGIPEGAPQIGEPPKAPETPAETPVTPPEVQ